MGVNEDFVHLIAKSKINGKLKKIEAQHTCMSIELTLNHINLDSNQIASIIVNSARTNPSILVKN